MLDQIKPMIVNCRRRNCIKESFERMDALIKANIGDVCRTIDTRWLVSICDTYADHGEPVDARNAMLISVYVNMEKICQSWLAYRVNYQDPLKDPEIRLHRPQLWDGMVSLHLKKEDTSNNLFKRYRSLLKESPHLLRIWETIKSRMDPPGPPVTISGAINKIHGHYWDENKGWIYGNK